MLRDTDRMDQVLGMVRRAFAGDVRPPNAALLHPACHDDMDLDVLYGFDHWRDVPDNVIISEYAALAFLSPEGFRHFIPAYMIWVLRHPDAAESVVDSIVWSFLPELHGPGLEAFVRSKWSALNVAQRTAVTAFLRGMIDHHEDAGAALASWLRNDGAKDPGTAL